MRPIPFDHHTMRRHCAIATVIAGVAGYILDAGWQWATDTDANSKLRWVLSFTSGEAALAALLFAGATVWHWVRWREQLADGVVERAPYRPFRWPWAR